LMVACLYRCFLTFWLIEMNKRETRRHQEQVDMEAMSTNGYHPVAPSASSCPLGQRMYLRLIVHLPRLLILSLLLGQPLNTKS
jgi:hypothetical protein